MLTLSGRNAVGRVTRGGNTVSAGGARATTTAPVASPARTAEVCVTPANTAATAAATSDTATARLPILRVMCD